MPELWSDLQTEVKQQIEQMWTNGTPEITRMQWGVIPSGAGTGHQYFTSIVHAEAYLILLGQHLLFDLMKIARRTQNLDETRELTRELTSGTFDSWEFLADLGLESIGVYGGRYLAALDSLTSIDEYVLLTGTMLTYVTRMQRWCHFAFPWNVGGVFPQRTVSQLQSASAAAVERQSA